MTAKPLLIFDLEGTLGDVFAGYEPPLMRIRPGLLSGLKSFRTWTENPDMALATKAPLEKIQPFLDYLKRNSFEFDSVHDRSVCSISFPDSVQYLTHRFKNLATGYGHHQIDFEEIPARVIVIEDIQLDPTSIFIGTKKSSYKGKEYSIVQNGDELLFGKGGQMNVYGNPFPCQGMVPTVLLAPHPFKVKDLQAISFTAIEETVLKIYLAGQGDFNRGYSLLIGDDIIKHQTTFHRMSKDAYSLRENRDLSKNIFIKELLASFEHRYVVMQAEKYECSEYEKIEL